MVRSIAEVAVNVPLLKLFHYEVPRNLSERVELGHRVLIPFGAQTLTGVCVAFPNETDIPKLKPIRQILHPDCRFDAHLLELTRWIADYYHVGWGEVLDAALPPSIKSQKEKFASFVVAIRSSDELLKEVEDLGKKAPSRRAALNFLAANAGPHPRDVFLEKAPCGPAVLSRLLKDGWARIDKKPLAPEYVVELEAGVEPTERPTLHPDQDAAVRAIGTAIDSGTFSPILIHGVTGSGKTEVYLRALHQVLAAGRRGLILVPEISLTPQTVLRFREGLPDASVAVLHSMLTPKQRRDQWRKIQSGNARVVIGARSTIFAPAADLGIIIVDEEHDSSYKQESSPRYNARDVAVVRARMLGIPVLLGSATPTLETLHNARSGKYQLLELPERATKQRLPAVRTTALGAEYYRLDGSGLISDDLDTQIRKSLRSKEQIMLFLNRRGFATYLHCFRCGFVLSCEECDITLTYHRREELARCHYCDHRIRVPEKCPDCGMPHLRRSGVGTEKITNELARRYPDANVARLDRDTVTNFQTLQETLQRFGEGEYNILVGTQMIAKGHDFPGVTLVGIINADTGLHFPDFRAAERTYQLITQVSGRAGRGEQKGRVIIQTFTPDHYSIDCAARLDFSTFVQKEMGFRKTLGYPPFGRVVKIGLQCEDLDKLNDEGRKLAEALKASAPAGCRVLGPAPAPIARIQGKHRLQIIMKSPSSRDLHEALKAIETSGPKRRSKVERSIDVDPQSML